MDMTHNETIPENYANRALYKYIQQKGKRLRPKKEHACHKTRITFWEGNSLGML